MIRPRGINHLAISTGDMKRALTFYCQVLGLPLVGLFKMHGVRRASHAFVELEPGRYLSFIQFADAAAQQPGVTHATWPGDPTAPATMQHVALHCASEADLTALAGRIEAAGVRVSDVIDHGFCKSIYLSGPDGECLELTANVRPIGEADIDPRTVERCGISPDELRAMQHPDR